ncbi:MAG: dihydroorotate dehydrogenase electron transfer subunit [Chloroflexota bacterium]|nr:dihydroorotate dehydrogenase electron transfer subunit [Chloroflexota bacterium]
MTDATHRVVTVRKVVSEGETGVTLIFDNSIVADAGQFVMVWLPDVGERPFSVMDDYPLSLTIADVGPFTHALCALSCGDRLWIRGPYGKGFRIEGRRHLLVAGGSGAASLALVAKVARRQGDRVIVFLGAGTESHLMLRWRFGELGCRLIVATDDGSEGYQGSVLDALQNWREDIVADMVYGCGPEPMLAALAQYAQKTDVPLQVSLEAVMKCGLGVCGNCHRGDRLVCKDGPVFSGQVFSHALQLDEMS